MSPGRSAPARRREARGSRPSTTRAGGGYTFAEDPGRAAPDARIIWHADLDPGALRARAEPADASDPDAIIAGRLDPWLAVAVDANGAEHAVLSDGWHHIRIDVEEGSLIAGVPVVLHYRIAGLAGAEPKLLPLARLIDLCRRRCFARSLFPPDVRRARQLLVLRVHDARVAGASQREIAERLFGAVPSGSMGDRSDSLRSRVRRLVREARRMTGGGYRELMQRGR